MCPNTRDALFWKECNCPYNSVANMDRRKQLNIVKTKKICQEKEGLNNNQQNGSDINM